VTRTLRNALSLVERGTASLKMRRDVALRMLLPLGLLTLIGVFATVIAVGRIVEESDRLSRVAQADMLAEVIGDFRDIHGEFAIQSALSMAEGLETGELERDPGAFDFALVPAGPSRFHHQFAQVVSGEGRVLGAHPIGETALPGPILDVVSRLRASGAIGRLDSSNARPVVTDMAILNGQLVLVAVAPLPLSLDYMRRHGGTHDLISVLTIDHSRISYLEALAQARDLRLVPGRVRSDGVPLIGHD
jgi:hypothetical protein